MRKIDFNPNRVVPPNTFLGEFSLLLETDDNGNLQIDELSPVPVMISPEAATIDTGDVALEAYSCLLFYPSTNSFGDVLITLSPTAPFRFSKDKPIIIVCSELGEQVIGYSPDAKTLDISEACRFFQTGDLVRFTYIAESNQVILDLVVPFSQ
jgi:hypothetical protein